MKEVTKTDEQIIREKITEKLVQKDVPVKFPIFEMTKENTDGLYKTDEAERKDLREIDCFTIDGPTAKELDDALSLNLTEYGYRLGVHIADVAAYVSVESKMEIEAESMGTTIYFPGYSIPMFPGYISEQTCSLNPDSDKKAVTMFIDFAPDGKIIGYEVCRSLIRSRVRGVYSEVNAIIEHTADDAVLSKYEPVVDEIMNMKQLAELLRNRRANIGASVCSADEFKYRFIDEMLELTSLGNTAADMIVCEFMVAANTCMSFYFEDNKLPGLYRVQKAITANASYSTLPHNHESLAVCGGYMRFTSPIRRTANFQVHQVLAAYLSGAAPENLRDEYLEKMTAYCGQAQLLEERARELERSILRECHFLYFAKHMEDSFRGVVIGANNYSDDAVISLQPYNIRILGAVCLSKYVRQEFQIKVMVDNERGYLRVGHISRISAA